jgi:hypothetical protein
MECQKHNDELRTLLKRFANGMSLGIVLDAIDDT